MTVAVLFGLPCLLALAVGGNASAAETNRSPATPNDGMDWVQRGNAAYRSGQRSNAIYFFTQAIAVNPTNANAYYNRGRIQDVEGNTTNALADLNRLLEINPDHPGGCHYRGALLLRFGQLKEAL